MTDATRAVYLQNELQNQGFILSECGSVCVVPQRNGTLGEQGWRSGESARLLPMCPGFNSRTRHHMWTEFVGYLLCSERSFSRYSGFPLSSKTNLEFNLISFDLFDLFIWFDLFGLQSPQLVHECYKD